MHPNAVLSGLRSWLGWNARRYERSGGVLCAAVLCGLSVHADFGSNEGTSLASVYAQQVDRRLNLPESEQRAYAELLANNLTAEDSTAAQYVVIVDRNKFVQAAMIYWMSPDGIFHFIGASPVSTGKPGRFDHFVTPTGVFAHTIDNPDFLSQGTRNEFGIRGYGRKGMRVYDFGWQTAQRGWGGGGEGELRLQMHATDPNLLEKKLGTPQSKGCIRIPATLNAFIDHYGILDGDYEKAMAEGMTFWVLPKTREATPWSGRFLVVVDTGRTKRPAWSPPPREVR
jgi:lipoprotein-anchoring transpeptidase ErfK/SrfK